MTFTRFPALSRRRLLMRLGAASLSFTALGRGSGAVAGTAQKAPGGVTALAFEQGRLVLAAGDIWSSTDGGASFVTMAEAPGMGITALATHPDLSGVIYATAASGLKRSVDAGLTWQPAGLGLPTTPLDAVAIAAHDPKIIYVAVRGDGIWQSKDGAKTWEFAMDRPLVDKAEVDIQVLASVGTLSGMGGYWVYVGTSKGVSKVPDCFCRWSSVESGGAMAVSSSAAKAAIIDPAQRLPHLSATSLVLAPSVPDVLFAGLPSGIWKTTDSGATWALVNAALAQPYLAIDPNEPNHIVAATSDGTMLSSPDSGVTWAAPAAV